MYLIIENNVKEENNIFHGYTNNKETAIYFIKKKLLEYKNDDKILKINELNYNTNYEDFSNKKSKSLYRYNLIEIERINNDQCIILLKEICKENNIEKKNITIKNLIEYFVKSENEIIKLKKEFEFDEKVNIDIQKYIIEYLIYNDYGNVEEKLKLKRNVLNKYFDIMYIYNILDTTYMN